ncbi:MAG: hypothetical protein AABZ30_00535 [Myxococcota bacterium]
MTLIEREVSALPQADRDKALKILAKSIYRELKAYGYESRQIVALSTELIALVTQDMREESTHR